MVAPESAPSCRGALRRCACASLRRRGRPTSRRMESHGLGLPQVCRARLVLIPGLSAVEHAIILDIISETGVIQLARQGPSRLACASGDRGVVSAGRCAAGCRRPVRRGSSRWPRACGAAAASRVGLVPGAPARACPWSSTSGILIPPNGAVGTK